MSAVKNIITRFSIVKAFIIFFGLVVAFRLFQIQVINQSRYKAEAKKQQFQNNIIFSKRGGIYTSDGYPLVQSVQSNILYIRPNDIENFDSVVENISSILNIKNRDLRDILTADSKRIKVATGLDYFQISQIKKLNYGFVQLESDFQRSYPEKNMLSHILGFVGKDRNGFQTGYYGLEQYYDGDLSGRPGLLSEEKSASGDVILVGMSDEVVPIDGSNITTTIDRNVQFITERLLADGVAKYGAKSGSVVVVEPKTGAILAMVNYPNFEPNEYTKYVDNKEMLRNSAISEVYEPGSVMKAITMASAIDAGAVRLDSTYNDTGVRTYSGHKVDNWDGKHHGVETLTSILQHSNNLGAGWVGMQLGDENLLGYFDKFGLGRKLGIDLEGEESGIIYKRLPLKDIETVNASFGQGVSFTPLQVTMSFSAIANEGYLMKPRVVKSISDSNGNKRDFDFEVFSRPISKETSETMVKMLTDAVAGGEAKFFVTKEYKVAGKTGTAQIATKGGYSENLTNATFVGFFPSYRDFVMLVKLEEPSFPSGYAAETAVPLWMQIAEELAGYYNLPPDK